MKKNKLVPIFKLLYQNVDLSRFSLEGPKKTVIEDPKKSNPDLTTWQLFNRYQSKLEDLKEKEKNVKTFLEIKKAVVVEKKNYDKTYGADSSGSFEEEVEESFRGLVHKIDQYLEKAILKQIKLLNKKVQLHSRACKIEAFDKWKAIRKDFDKKLDKKVKLLESSLNRYLETPEIRGLKMSLDKKVNIGVGDYFYFFCRQMGESLEKGENLLKKFEKKVEKTFLRQKEIGYLYHQLKVWRNRLEREEEKLEDRLSHSGMISDNRFSYFDHLIEKLSGKMKFQKEVPYFEEIRVLTSEREVLAKEAMEKMLAYFIEAKKELLKALDEILNCFEGKQKFQFGYVY